MKHILLIFLLLIAACKEFDIEHTITCDSSGSATWRLHIIELPDAECYKNPESCESGALDFIQIMEEAGGTGVEIIDISTEPPFEYMITAQYRDLDDILKLLAEDQPELFIESTSDGYRIKLWEDGPYTDPTRVATVDEDFIPLKMIASGGEISLKNQKSSRLVKITSINDFHGLEFIWPMCEED